MSRFGRETAAEEIARTADLRGRTAVLTGASSGLGAETARALAIAGAELVLGVRDPAKGEQVARDIEPLARSGIRVLPLDLANLHSVIAFAERIEGAVDLLIANAGVSKTPETHLPNGLDVRFATNHLGHFLLAHRLKPQMAERGARLVVLSSAAHKGMKLRLDDLQWHKREFSLAAYGESKTANIIVRAGGDAALGGRRHLRQCRPARLGADRPAALSWRGDEAADRLHPAGRIGQSGREDHR